MGGEVNPPSLRGGIYTSSPQIYRRLQKKAGNDDWDDDDDRWDDDDDRWDDDRWDGEKADAATTRVGILGALGGLIPFLIVMGFVFGCSCYCRQKSLKTWLKGDKFHGEAEDFFNGLKEPVTLRQRWRAIELCGIEAKNRYTLHYDEKGQGETLSFTREESQCAERICCKSQREATWFMHQGQDQSGRVLMKVHKDFHLKGSCCCRLGMQVLTESDQQIGRIYDPCTWEACFCKINQYIYDAAGALRYLVYGSCCQCGLFCPCCAEFKLGIHDMTAQAGITGPTGPLVGSIRRLTFTCSELFLPEKMRMRVDWPAQVTAEDRALLLAACVGIDLEYFQKE